MSEPHVGVKTPSAEPTPGGEHQPTVIYRHLGTEVAPDCEPDCNWQVEMHADRGFPVGLAWVLAPAPGAEPTSETRPQIKFVLVVDDERRQGIATRLIEACRERWPTIQLSPPISAAGAGLYRKLRPPPRAEDWFNEDFIRRQLAAGVTREELDQLARRIDDQMSGGLIGGDEPVSPGSSE
jgi:GNAT superfamily N-acetyltransferase